MVYEMTSYTDYSANIAVTETSTITVCNQLINE